MSAHTSQSGDGRRELNRRGLMQRAASVGVIGITTSWLADMAKAGTPEGDGASIRGASASPLACTCTSCGTDCVGGCGTCSCGTCASCACSTEGACGSDEDAAGAMIVALADGKSTVVNGAATTNQNVLINESQTAARAQHLNSAQGRAPAKDAEHETGWIAGLDPHSHAKPSVCLS